LKKCNRTVEDEFDGYSVEGDATVRMPKIGITLVVVLVTILWMGKFGLADDFPSLLSANATIGEKLIGT
jgi:hypothetical protein